ncbi:predicted protein [Histoplasma capsulatum var. duboisii H88]|uniref:Predicted protein n=1 Tax=Ajellomyces capsulatus (strain H88) TaxID=544711 RepID=F0UCZ9_AJEC8|nr:predicted protein [Histoplasma capsulatum var. duboisii H88]
MDMETKALTPVVNSKVVLQQMGEKEGVFGEDAPFAAEKGNARLGPGIAPVSPCPHVFFSTFQGSTPADRACHVDSRPRSAAAGCKCGNPPAAPQITVLALESSHYNESANEFRSGSSPTYWPHSSHET